MAGQPDGIAGIIAGGQIDGTSAVGSRFPDGVVDGMAVDGLAVSFGSEVLYIIYVLGLLPCRGRVAGRVSFSSLQGH